MTNKHAGDIMKRLFNTHVVKRPEAKQTVNFRIWCQFEHGYLQIICDRCNHEVVSVNQSEEDAYMRRGYRLAPIVEILQAHRCQGASVPCEKWRRIPGARTLPDEGC